MVRIIERSTVNGELFDKLWDQVKATTMSSISLERKVWPSMHVLMLFARALRIGVVSGGLMAQMNAYCQRYPYTMLVNR